MSRRVFFEKPTQVRFWECAEQDYVGGIAYEDKIICGCCGGILEIEEIYDNAAADAEDGEIAPAEDEVIQELSWIPINEEITGDDFRAHQRVNTVTEPPREH